MYPCSASPIHKKTLLTFSGTGRTPSCAWGRILDWLATQPFECWSVDCITGQGYSMSSQILRFSANWRQTFLIRKSAVKLVILTFYCLDSLIPCFPSLFIVPRYLNFKFQPDYTPGSARWFFGKCWTLCVIGKLRRNNFEADEEEERSPHDRVVP